MRIYAIGDVHGHLTELERAHRLIADDRARTGDAAAHVVHVGDLCDRGPDTKGVIDFLLAGEARGEPWVTLKGNHDRLMEYFLGDEPRLDPYMLVGWTWFTDGVGGIETLTAVRQGGERDQYRYGGRDQQATHRLPGNQARTRHRRS